MGDPGVRCSGKQTTYVTFQHYPVNVSVFYYKVSFNDPDLCLYWKNEHFMKILEVPKTNWNLQLRGRQVEFKCHNLTNGEPN